MPRLRSVVAIGLAAMLAAAPAMVPVDAWARAASTSSMGSRGTRTYTAPPATSTAPTTAQPMQRSMAQPTAPAAAAPRPGMASPAPARSGFMFGLLLQIALIAGIGWMLWRLFTRNRAPTPAMAGPAGMMGRSVQDDPRMGGGMAGGMGGGAMPQGPAQPPLAISPADYQAFERLLQTVQGAWSAHDMHALQTVATPEMVSYFAEQLTDQVSRGVRNSVTDVRLDKGDLSEAWSEGAREYATVAMRFSMLDATRDASGRVVDGSDRERVSATELWTFVRAPGGQWLLSAIQQAG